MESRFGRGLGDVRIHTGEFAEQANEALNANAFTLGRDIAFARGQFEPDSRPGRKLLAHELTHVVQQGYAGTSASDSEREASTVQRAPATTSATTAPAAPKVARRKSCDINESNPVIWFEHNSTTLRTGGGINSTVHLMRAIRRSQAHIAAAGGSAKVYLYGYASEEGSPDHNLDLSKRRASTIRSLLEAAGVPGSNLEAVGLGEDSSMSTRPLNRRVVICPTPQIQNITMPPLEIRGDGMNCAAPRKAKNLTQYAALVRCLEQHLASTHGPVDILKTLREIYYGGSKFDSAACGDRESATVAALKKRALPLYTALKVSKVTAGVDVGHIFTGLEGMLCPRTKTSPAWYAPSVAMANEDVLTWGGDIGSAAAGRLHGYNASGLIFKTEPPWSRYFERSGTLASKEDLRGDIDSFVMRAQQKGVACSGTKGTRMPAPSTPISQLLFSFYSTPKSMATGLTVHDRFRCFAEAIGATISGSSITNKAALVNRYAPQVYSFAQLFYLGMRKSHILTIDSFDLLRLISYSRQVTRRFFNWVESGL